MAGKFKYYEPSAEQLEKKINSSGSSGFDRFIKSEFELFTPEKGDNWVRVLPATWADADHWALSVFLHYGLGPDKGTALCLKRMKNEPCPICEYRAKMTGKMDDEDLRELRANERSLAWVIDRNAENEGPKLWSMSITKVDQIIAKLARDKATGEILPLTNPDYGYDIYFDRQGEGLRTQYAGFTLARKASSVADRHMEFICDNPIPTTLLWRDYDEMQALFEGTTPRKSDKDRKDKGRREEDTDKRGRRDEPESRTRYEDDRPEPRGRYRDDEPPRRGRDSDDPPPRRQRDDDEPPRRMREEPEERHTRRGREDMDDAPRRSREDAGDPPKRASRETFDNEPPRRGREEPEEPRTSGRSRAEELRERFSGRDR